MSRSRSGLYDVHGLYRRGCRSLTASVRREQQHRQRRAEVVEGANPGRLSSKTDVVNVANVRALEWPGFTNEVSCVVLSRGAAVGTTS